MMESGESRKEARIRKSQILTTKEQTRIGTWNVRTLNSTGKLAQVTNEMQKYKLDILGVSEMRWTGSGRMVSDGVTVYYSGGTSKHERGVGLLLNQRISGAVIQWEPVNDRIITVRLQSRYTKVTIVQVYAPTNTASDEEKDEFYEVLQQILDDSPEHDMKIVLGDFNAQVGKDNEGWEEAMGQQGLGERNDNGERLLSYCSVNKLKVGGSLFTHKDIHKGTWRSPNGLTVNQIDHICLSRRWISSLQDVRVNRGADVGSDHYLVTARIQMKLKSLGKKKAHQALDLDVLKAKDVQTKFCLELNNRFSLLEEKEDIIELGIEEYWKKIKDTVTDTAKKVIGQRRGSIKEKWITKRTWDAIDERRLLKAKKEQALNTGKQAEEIMDAYRQKDKEVKSRCRADKKLWVENKLVQAEEAAGRNDSKTLYRIVKDLSGKAAPRIPVSGADGKPLKSQEQEAKRWKQYFQDILNCPEPTEVHDFSGDCINALDISTEDITIEEVVKAIKKLKNGKAAGVDGIQAELLKYGGDELVRRITTLCNHIWTTGDIPADWCDGIIIPIPKKGDLRDCNNWRGITLLSVPGKVLCSIILDRLKVSVDKTLRQHQAGFRAGRSCCDQIFALRQILEKTTEMNCKLLVNFIDFRKAFDCVHRSSVWNIMKCYGIPTKIVDIIQRFYNNSRCAVRNNGQLGEWFQVVTGVRQGCILSPLIFLLVMDWVLKRSLDDSTCGIQWVNGGQLTDLDFADDIALVEDTWHGMAEITTRVEREAGAVGLRINADKTKLMVVGNMTDKGCIMAGGQLVETVEEFCYLGSVISDNSSCDKDIKTRLGKANSVFGRLNTIWKSRGLNCSVKIRLYESLVLSTLLYAAETWPMTVANMKKLEAAHHKWQRRILGVVWRDKVSNELVRRQTGMAKLEEMIAKRRLKWLGHVHRMDDNRVTKQALKWSPTDGKRKRGRPRKNWKATVLEDLKKLNLDWDEAEKTAEDRKTWQSCVAQCAAGTWKD
jgi:exonuclease III